MTIYDTFDDCPLWWKSFIDTVTDEIDKVSFFTPEVLRVRDKLLDDSIATYNGKIVDVVNNSSLVDYLEFETEYDLNAFKLFWILRGQ